MLPKYTLSTTAAYQNNNSHTISHAASTAKTTYSEKRFGGGGEGGMYNYIYPRERGRREDKAQHSLPHNYNLVHLVHFAVH